MRSETRSSPRRYGRSAFPEMTKQRETLSLSRNGAERVVHNREALRSHEENLRALSASIYPCSTHATQNKRKVDFSNAREIELKLDRRCGYRLQRRLGCIDSIRSPFASEASESFRKLSSDTRTKSRSIDAAEYQYRGTVYRDCFAVVSPSIVHLARNSRKLNFWKALKIGVNRSDRVPSPSMHLLRLVVLYSALKSPIWR